MNALLAAVESLSTVQQRAEARAFAAAQADRSRLFSQFRSAVLSGADVKSGVGVGDVTYVDLIADSLSRELEANVELAPAQRLHIRRELIGVFRRLLESNRGAYKDLLAPTVNEIPDQQVVQSSTYRTARIRIIGAFRKELKNFRKSGELLLSADKRNSWNVVLNEYEAALNRIEEALRDGSGVVPPHGLGLAQLGYLSSRINIP